jgi:hypothetical protein
MCVSRLVTVAVLTLLTGQPAFAFKPGPGARMREARSHHVALADGDELLIECDLLSALGQDPTGSANDYPQILDRPVIRFYRRQVLLRTVTLREVVTDPGGVRVQPWVYAGLPESARPAWWLDWSELGLFSPTFTVAGRDGTRTVFDIRTGGTVHQEQVSPWRRPFSGRRVIALMMTATLLAGGIVLLRRRAARPPGPSNDEPGPTGAGSGG